eukprot:CAMPEP_0178996596 /NCGR_PEP_ID=MMETSP0795-20121207/8452_1 /TAXON_ID=88552 /ORGANISM="Amoebophrya sp., Strain Ameob2" /LENGTH=157 /DNA_ID=CAMNT_0020688995 /DNA_START=284 /DNA_END=755 /DNA_ORIENTATION=-
MRSAISGEGEEPAEKNQQSAPEHEKDNGGMFGLSPSNGVGVVVIVVLVLGIVLVVLVVGLSADITDANLFTSFLAGSGAAPSPCGGGGASAAPPPLASETENLRMPQTLPPSSYPWLAGQSTRSLVKEWQGYRQGSPGKLLSPAPSISARVSSGTTS